MYDLKIESLNGFGKFCCNLIEFETEFELFQLPNSTYFLINDTDKDYQLHEAFSSEGHWELTGKLNDGRNIEGEEIYIMLGDFIMSGESKSTLPGYSFHQKFFPVRVL